MNKNLHGLFLSLVAVLLSFHLSAHFFSDAFQSPAEGVADACGVSLDIQSYFRESLPPVKKAADTRIIANEFKENENEDDERDPFSFKKNTRPQSCSAILQVAATLYNDDVIRSYPEHHPHFPPERRYLTFQVFRI